MKQLNQAIQEKSLVIGDEVTLHPSTISTHVETKSIVTGIDSDFLYLGSHSDLPMLAIPLASSPALGQYRITANHLIFHTFEHKLLGGVA